MYQVIEKIGRKATVVGAYETEASANAKIMMMRDKAEAVSIPITATEDGFIARLHNCTATVFIREANDGNGN